MLLSKYIKKSSEIRQTRHEKGPVTEPLTDCHLKHAAVAQLYI